MKKSMFFLLAVVLVAAFSCKRTDEVNPVPQKASQSGDSLKTQGITLTSAVIAGSYDQTGAADGISTGARFHSPMGIFTKSDGSLLVADHDNQAIRKIMVGGFAPGNLVTTPYHTPVPPNDVAAITDGAVGVVGDFSVIVYNHGTHFIKSVGCAHCKFAGIDNNAGRTFFWDGVNSSGSGLTSFLSSIDELSASPVHGITFSNPDSEKDPSTTSPITSFSVVINNDNKFLTTATRVFECTHSGTIFPILSGFTGLTSIIANHDGSKLYVADNGVIKVIARIPIFGPTLTTLSVQKGIDAYGLALSNNEKVLYFTSRTHHTVNSVALP